MSQEALEAAIGRLVCDDAFRLEFSSDAEGATLRRGLRLTPVELSSLRTVELRMLEAVAHQMSDSVRRASQPPARRG